MLPRPNRFHAFAALLITVAAPAAAATRLASEPHFLLLSDRDRIVLFTDGPVSGAVAEREANGSFEVVVPGVEIDAKLAGRVFDDAASGGDGTTRVRFVGTQRGDARVAVESRTPVRRVHAYAAAKPPRLMIELVRENARPVRQNARAIPSKRAPPARKTAPATLDPLRNDPFPATQRSLTPSEEPDAPSCEAETGDPPRPAESASQTAAGTAAIESAATRGTASTSEAPRATGPLLCRWRRVGGVPYCAPNPEAPEYAAMGVAHLAGQIDRERTGPELTTPPPGAAGAYLTADVELLRRALDGWILPVVTTYEQALRAHPDFADSSRARANIALIHHALGFEPELEIATRQKSNPAAPLASALLADLRREHRECDAGACDELLAVATAAGGFPKCLSARVTASLAADAGKLDEAREKLAALERVCPRTILDDSGTAWLRTHVELSKGAPGEAVPRLLALVPEVPRRERALLFTEVAEAQVEASDPRAARATYQRIADGALGARVMRLARVALAGLDALDGEFPAMESRLAEVSPDAANRGREEAHLAGAKRLLHEGKPTAALGMLSERSLDPTRLPAQDQILLAQSLRRLGLLDEAERWLGRLDENESVRLPDGFWEEIGGIAIARGDASTALLVADQWIAERAGATPPPALALRARALAARGDAKGAAEVVTKNLAALDPAMARDVALELAGKLRSTSPEDALVLARAAIESHGQPELAADRQAAALRTVAEAAEATGRTDDARNAFLELARDHGTDPVAKGAGYRASRLMAASGATPPAAPKPAKPDVAKVTAPADERDELPRRMVAADALYAEALGDVASLEQNP